MSRLSRNLLMPLFLASAVACTRNENQVLPLYKAEVTDWGDELELMSYYEEATAGFVQREINAVDILFSVENSGSMDAYIDAVLANVTRFTSELVSGGVDFQIGIVKGNDNKTGEFESRLQGPFPVVRASDPDPADRIAKSLEAVRNSAAGIDEHPLRALVDGLEDPGNGSLFREEAATFFMTLSDQDESDGSADWYYDKFEELTGGAPWRLIGIGSPVDNPCPNAEWRDHHVVSEVAKKSGGAMARICDPDYAAIMQAAVAEIKSMVSEISLAGFYGSYKIVDVNSIRVTVDGASVSLDPINGYTWDGMNASIVLHGTAIPAPGKKVEAAFEIINY